MIKLLLGWMMCDGSEIPEPSEWVGLTTPNLNDDGYFLRGGVPEDILTVQEDTVEDHYHKVYDAGHSHTDSGHDHSFYYCFSDYGSYFDADSESESDCSYKYTGYG